MKLKALILSTVTILLLGGNFAGAQTPAGAIPNNEKLVILWTSGDRDVALKMVFMYAGNAPRFEWWKDITLIVWGPSSKLLSEDPEVQESFKKMLEAGIVAKACKACSDQYGVSDKLTTLGVEVKYMGGELTEYIKGDYNLITI
ncbi:MAG: DsrE family protein [Candidatus Neomarinimicrobiota bacterium]